jgi:hypothetical protein
MSEIEYYTLQPGPFHLLDDPIFATQNRVQARTGPVIEVCYSAGKLDLRHSGVLLYWANPGFLKQMGN